MSSPDRNPDFDRWGRTQRVIWLNFLIAALAYLGMAVYLARSPGVGRVPGMAVTLRILFYPISVGLFVVALMLRRRFDERTFVDVGTAVRAAQTSFVVRWALLETPGILGLVLVMLGSRLVDVVPLLLLTFVGIVVQRPDPSRLAGQVHAGAPH